MNILSSPTKVMGINQVFDFGVDLIFKYHVDPPVPLDHR